MSGLTIQKIHKSFGEKRALQGVSFEVAEGEIVAVLGPSGCGKSTLLNIVAGLEQPDQGSLEWDGQPLVDVPSHLRGFGLMFQDFALFPHRDVFGNVAFGLRMAGWPEERIRIRVQEVLELVGMPGFAKRDVNTLSGGEAQRVALARSLAPHPRLLMLDEPLGSLDRNLRERLAVDLGKILRLSHQTAIYVTHDLQEAFTLADRVVVMNAGAVEQIDPPQAIYRHPRTAFVAHFVGLDNLLPGQVRAVGGKTFIQTAVGELPAPEATPGPALILLRPDAAHLLTPVSGGISGSKTPADCDPQTDFDLQGQVSEIAFQGSLWQLTLQINAARLIFDFPSSLDLPDVGETAHLGFHTRDSVQVFPSQPL